jgi:hypothetical protein
LDLFLNGEEFERKTEAAVRDDADRHSCCRRSWTAASSRVLGMSGPGHDPGRRAEYLSATGCLAPVEEADGCV